MRILNAKGYIGVYAEDEVVPGSIEVTNEELLALMLEGVPEGDLEGLAETLAETLESSGEVFDGKIPSSNQLDQVNDRFTELKKGNCT